MNHRLLRAFALAATAMMAISSSLSAAEEAKPAIDLGASFADHAVLQSGMPVPVWGWSKPMF